MTTSVDSTSRLKSLVLQGYKTFASKTDIALAPKVTVVVGPNGSGKSNIADAIRWVLGEQSYSLLRGKKTVMLKVTLTEQPKETMVAMDRDRPSAKLGITVQALTPELANQFGYRGEKGVLVTRVDPDGPAAKATPTPIRQSDLIQEIDQKPVTTAETYRAAVQGANLARGILMLVRSRDGTRRFVVVKKK